MTPTQAAFDQLLDEHIALTRQYGAVQNKCSHVLQAQRAEIARLEAEVLRLRAAMVVRGVRRADAAYTEKA
ncbi:MAG: hypothetical protein JWP29_2832 [Rhodoferax sp.]|nr:hypothetical protein [Rhodoferax sp.]